MTYHTILKTSKDFYSALIEARALSDSISETLSIAATESISESHPNVSDPTTTVEVFPYSVFYVFYEQYLTIWNDTLISLSISLASIFIVTFVLLGLDIHSALTVGISVEFCSHIVRVYAVSIEPSRVDRAKESLVKMGTSVSKN